MYNANLVGHINTLTTFLAADQHPPQPDTPDCVFLLAGNAILAISETVFDYLLDWDTPTTLVIAGGIGHSTQLLYDAVAQHPRYGSLSADISGWPEARVIELILRRFWPALDRRVASGQLKLLIDDQSTNCGENGTFAKRLLDDAGIVPATLVVVQDPTMSIRTGAGVKKAYETIDRPPPKVLTWSTFTPSLQVEDDEAFSWSNGTLTAVKASSKGGGLWTEQRFIDLILGEIPRLRQYGPSGAGYIVHVEIPHEVEQADVALRGSLTGAR